MTEDFFNKVVTHWKKELPFVLYKKPNESQVSAYLNKSSKLIINSDYSQSGFVFSPFLNSAENSIWFTEESSEVISVPIDFKSLSTPLKPTDNMSSQSRSKHINSVDKALLEIEKKHLKKVIVSRVESVHIEKQQPIKWFKKMASLYSNTFCYCWYHPKIGMWIGATPETLISLKQTTFETIALAGTMTYKGTTDVKWGNKEIEEQKIVVDSILNSLKPLVTAIDKGETHTQKAGTLLHLKTLIKGQLRHASQLKELIEVLHPTSAVCGLPKLKAKEFIVANEGYDRGFYTGYLGEYQPESNTELFVNLRCMEIQKEIVNIYVGGGITKASNPDLEWEETVNKSQIMKAIL